MPNKCFRPTSACLSTLRPTNRNSETSAEPKRPKRKSLKFKLRHYQLRRAIVTTVFSFSLGTAGPLRPTWTSLLPACYEPGAIFVQRELRSLWLFRSQARCPRHQSRHQLECDVIHSGTESAVGANPVLPPRKRKLRHHSKSRRAPGRRRHLPPFALSRRSAGLQACSRSRSVRQPAPFQEYP